MFDSRLDVGRRVEREGAGCQSFERNFEQNLALPPFEAVQN